MLELAKENGLTPEQATYKLVQSLVTLLPSVSPPLETDRADLFYVHSHVIRCAYRLGIVPLSGTTSETHMKQDLEVIATPNWDQEVLLRDIIMDVLEG